VTVGPSEESGTLGGVNDVGVQCGIRCIVQAVHNQESKRYCRKLEGCESYIYADWTRCGFMFGERASKTEWSIAGIGVCIGREWEDKPRMEIYCSFLVQESVSARIPVYPWTFSGETQFSFISTSSLN
jgi:hypothetical protein